VPDLHFRVEGAHPVAHAASPLLSLRLHISNAAADPIHAVLLRCQIQIETPRRAYRETEQEGLADLFGAPARWATTLKPLLWTQLGVTVPGFDGETRREHDADASVPRAEDGVRVWLDDVARVEPRRPDVRDPAAGRGVRDRQHDPAADPVEQRAEQDRAEEVAERERDDVVADVVRLRVHQVRQHEAVREEDRVVGEGLRAHHRQAEHRAAAVAREHRARDLSEPRRLARLDLDRVLALLELGARLT